MPLISSDMSSRRALALFAAAVLIYSLWGVPTPELLRWPEYITGLLLVASITPLFIWRFVRRDTQETPLIVFVLLVYSLTIPLFMALFSGNTAEQVFRDVIAALFLLMPWLVIERFRDGTRTDQGLLALIVISGFLMGTRVLLGAYDPAAGGMKIPVPDPEYLANLPTVLFAALVLFWAGIHWGVMRHHFFRAVVFLMASFALVYVMAGIGQRATTGLFALSAFVIIALYGLRAPVWMACFLGTAFIGLWLILDEAAYLAEGLIRKTQAVGLNMRFEEARAVMESLEVSGWAVMFGRGWGAMYESPAVGGEMVNFTHNFFTHYWLKTGLVGLVLITAYISLFVNVLIRLFFARPVFALILGPPLLIMLTLYASFKSFDFGLFLLAVLLTARLCGVLKEGHREDKLRKSDPVHSGVTNA